MRIKRLIVVLVLLVACLDVAGEPIGERCVPTTQQISPQCSVTTFCDGTYVVICS